MFKVKWVSLMFQVLPPSDFYKLSRDTNALLAYGNHDLGKQSSLAFLFALGTLSIGILA